MRNIIFKILYFFGIHKLLHNKLKKDDIIVLCLHEVSDNGNFMYPPLTVSTFKKLIDYIEKHFSIVSFQEVLNNPDNNFSKPRIILSFDDGHQSFYDNILKFLIERKISVNQNIVVDCAEGKNEIWTDKLNKVIAELAKNKSTEIQFKSNSYRFGKNENNLSSGLNLFLELLKYPDTDKLDFICGLEQHHNINYQIKYMDWNKVNECAENSVEIGSHSLSHATISVENDLHKVMSEVIDSKKIIEEKISKTINIFSLPNGMQSEQLYKIVKQANYKLLLTTKPKYWNPKEDSFIVPRIPLTGKNFYESIFEMYNFHSIFNKERFD